MNSPWPVGESKPKPNLPRPAQSVLPTAPAAKTKIPQVSLQDVDLLSHPASTCTPSSSKVESTADSTTAEGTPKNSVLDGSEFACEMELINVAEVRAEQQAAARETMLSLMNALQGALRMQRDLEQERADDRQKIKDLQASLQQLQLDDNGQAEEQLQAALQRVAELEDQLEVLDAHSEESKLLERCRRQKKATTVREFARYLMKKPPGLISYTDKLVLRWVMTSWDNHVQSKKYHTTVHACVQTECRGIDLDEQERRVTDQLHKVQEKLKMSEQNCKQIQEERDSLLQQITDMRAEKQRVDDELARTKAQAAQANSEVEHLRRLLRTHEDDVRQAEAAWETERRALHATIRDVSSQLGSAIAQARHMEMMMQRAKKNSSELFREQMAQMVADLEAAKHRLSQMGKERDQAVEAKLGMQRHLGRKVRQIELERQFLPLIHHAQGPLGMRSNPVTSQSDSALPTIGTQTREKFKMTQGAKTTDPTSVLE